MAQNEIIICLLFGWLFVWALCSISAYWKEKNEKKKNIEQHTSRPVSYKIPNWWPGREQTGTVPVHCNRARKTFDLFYDLFPIPASGIFSQY